MSIYINKFQYVNGKYVQQRIPYKRNYCKDCKHFSKNGELCRLFVVVDLVNGNENTVKASNARDNGNMCGLGASSFEPIDKPKITSNDIEK
jgi:hypothetical protein